LLHPFFDELYSPEFFKKAYDDTTNMPDLFNFTDEELAFDPETIQLIKDKIIK